MTLNMKFNDEKCCIFKEFTHISSPWGLEITKNLWTNLSSDSFFVENIINNEFLIFLIIQMIISSLKTR